MARDRLSWLIFLLSAHSPAARKAPSEKVLRDGERIKTMLRYIEEHLGEALTAARIAQSAAVSESECLRCFRSMIGTSPIQYVRQLRVQRAAELLEATDWKIADIGAACGFQGLFRQDLPGAEGPDPQPVPGGVPEQEEKGCPL